MSPASPQCGRKTKVSEIWSDGQRRKNKYGRKKSRHTEASGLTPMVQTGHVGKQVVDPDRVLC